LEICEGKEGIFWVGRGGVFGTERDTERERWERMEKGRCWIGQRGLRLALVIFLGLTSLTGVRLWRRRRRKRRRRMTGRGTTTIIITAVAATAAAAC